LTRPSLKVLKGLKGLKGVKELKELKGLIGVKGLKVLKRLKGVKGLKELERKMKSCKSSVRPRYIFMYLIMLLFPVLSLLTHLVIEKQNRINFISRGPMVIYP
jgi:hypothetical protein